MSLTMPSPTSIKLSALKQKQKFSACFFVFNLCKLLGISGLALYFIYLLHFKHSNCPPCHPNHSDSHFPTKISDSDHHPNYHSDSDHDSPTNLTHLVFGLVSSVKSWKPRRPYIESWWRPNMTRGYLFLDEPPTEDLLPWPPTSPPLRISDDYSQLEKESNHTAPIMIRMVLAITETFRQRDEGVRWYVMGFDDSIFFVDNWVDVLAKYDHTKYVYIGGQSETILSNMFFSFDQGFGGGGVALSYPLVAALVKDLEGCIRRYPYVSSADTIVQVCVDELGISLTVEKGIHQIDLKGDISGFLSSHPQAPLLSLHHFDYVDPIFPTMDRLQSTTHLVDAGKVDQLRLLQQTICYHRAKNWSFSLAWGYSVHIYENIYARTMLRRPLETFISWVVNATPPMFMFNTRWPCETPNVFFFESIGRAWGDQVLTTYVRSPPPKKPDDCKWKGNQFAREISKIQVFSSASKLTEVGRSECCDIVHKDGMNIAEVQIRSCKDDEIIG